MKSFFIDDLVEQLIFGEKIERGNQQSKNGEFLSEEQHDKEIEK